VTTPKAYHRIRIASEKIREAKAKEPSATRVSDGPRCGDWIFSHVRSDRVERQSPVRRVRWLEPKSTVPN